MVYEQGAIDARVLSSEASEISAFRRRVFSELTPDLDNSKPFILPLESTKTEFANAELKSAIDSASSITVTDDPSNADVVLKTDGSLEQFLKVNSGEGRLVIAIEEGDDEPDLAKDKQFQICRSVLEYIHRSGKTIEMDFSAHSDDFESTAFDTRQTSAGHSVSQGWQTSLSPWQGDSSRSPIDLPRWQSNSSRSQIAQFRTDWSQVDLFDLLMDWFESDGETFKKLLPGLFKKIAGTNGRIDQKKLRQLVDSKDPGLKLLRAELPRLSEAFPNVPEPHGNAHKTLEAHEKVSTSCDAINPTGAKLADKAAQVSDELGTYGYCAKGVSYAIERATGKIIYGNANDMRKSLPEEGFTVSNSKKLKVGQVVHVYWTPEVYAQEQARRGPCPNYGDIAVIGRGRDGQLYAYNDAATPLNDYLQKSRYDWSTLKVFNPPNS